jgi:glycosyltransferase involved in cell wall biosynthesis
LVLGMTMQPLPASTGVWQGVRLVSYRATRGSTAQIHPWVSDFETKVIRGDACFRAALALKAQGFTPDVIVAHPGWGESLFIKDVWPQAKLGLYCEFFYQASGSDVGFDPEFPVQDVGDACRLRLKNLNNLLHFETADAAISPTHWQASTYPAPFRERISVIHDGINTQAITPNPQARLALNRQGQSVTLTRESEIITFVSRNLEPYRGYHIFMRALPELLRQRPAAQVLIVGSDQVSYGAKPDPAKHGFATWKEVFLAEAKPHIAAADWQRVHFLGQVPHQQFITLLQLSTVHVYLTYPFVLSWSLLEAMSAGCAIVASDTQPLLEAIAHNQTGRLVNFFDHAALVENVVSLLQDRTERIRLGTNARAHAVAHYDLHSRCLPQQLAWVEQIR